MHRLLFVLLSLCVSAASAVTTKELIGEAVYVEPGTVVVLQAYQGTCTKGKRVVMLMNAEGAVGAFIGCWRLENGLVITEFEDGDVFRQPEQVYQWSAKPPKPDPQRM